jgi:hypothetical protein
MESLQDNRFHEALLMSLAFLGRFRSFNRRMTIGNIGAISSKTGFIGNSSAFSNNSFYRGIACHNSTWYEVEKDFILSHPAFT